MKTSLKFTYSIHRNGDNIFLKRKQGNFIEITEDLLNNYAKAQRETRLDSAKCQTEK